MSMPKYPSTPQDLRILAVEQDVPEQKLLLGALQAIVRNPVLAASGREALRKVQLAGYDLIIVSRSLTDFPARFVIETIRRQESWNCKVPILLLGDGQAAEDDSSAQALGADAYMSKPLQVSRFLATVLQLASAGQRLREQQEVGWSLFDYPIRGIEDLRAPASGTDFEVTQLRPGLMDGRINNTILGKSVFSLGTWKSDTDLKFRGSYFKDTVYLVTGFGPSYVHSLWGKDVPFGDKGVVLAASGGHEFDGLFRPGLVRYAAIAVPESFFYEVAQILAPNLRRIRDPMVIQPLPRMRFAVTKAIHRALQAAKHLRQNEGVGFDPDSLGLSIIAPLMVALDGQEAIRPMRGDRRIISRVEELARSNDLNTSLPGFCLQLGESPGRLRLAFRRELDTSPAHYLVMLKLCRARDDLSRGHQVVSAAYKHGFHDLGRFARHYKHVFGEYPSETVAARGVFRLGRLPGAARHYPEGAFLAEEPLVLRLPGIKGSLCIYLIGRRYRVTDPPLRAPRLL
jgi:AraC-like DNA-binding protein/CheY-like chemotaxis protein